MSIILIGLLISLVAMTVRPACGNEGAKMEFLDELGDRILAARQDWGQLGMKTCAHLPNSEGIPLQVGKTKFERGLGHHANGEIVIDLNGEYSRFETRVGVQWLPEDKGSVVFKVLVDGREKFNSGVMTRESGPKKVDITVDGAVELELVALDAGDGITCDCADWIDARLTRNPGGHAAKRVDVDIAPFSRVTKSDPARMDGARAGRIEEYHKEDIYLEVDSPKDADGNYEVFEAEDGRHCIGLSWIERRRVRDLSITFAEGTAPKDTSEAQVQYWAGATPYQGRWVGLDGTITANGDRWVCEADLSRNQELVPGTWKFRWVFPAEMKQLRISGLHASSVARYFPAKLRVEVNPESRYELELYNGRILEGDPAKDSTLRVLGTRSRPWQPEHTVLLFRFPKGAFGVALDDVLANEAVYVEDFGLLVSLDEANLTLEKYRKSIAGKMTVLDDVRERPDQTFEEALKIIHNPAQNLQPTMLSLSCDNRKFIVERNGTVQFSSEYDKSDDFVATLQPLPCRLLPVFGSGANDGLTRRLDGEWLPAPVTEVRENGVLYSQRTFVSDAPSEMIADDFGDKDGSSHPVFVAQFTMHNEGDAEAEVSLGLSFLLNAEGGEPAHIRKEGGSSILRVMKDDQSIAQIDLTDSSHLSVSVDGGKASLKGKLKAGESAECVVLVPAWKWSNVRRADAEDLFKIMRNHWQAIMDSATQVEIPDPLLMNVIRASQVHCLIASRNEADFHRIAPWIASVTYGPLESESNSIIRGMDLLGHEQFAQRSLDYFIYRYQPSGLLTTGYTVMGLGWHLQTVGRHYALAQDDEWLRSHASDITRACEWIIRQRAKTVDTPNGIDMPQKGLMPPGVMADWNAYAYYFCLNGYFCAALSEAGNALADIDFPGADKLVDEADEFRADILRAFHSTQTMMPVYSLRDGTSVPGYPTAVGRPGPSDSYYPGEDGNRSWCYDVELGAHHLVPQGILDPDSKDVEWMMNHMEDVQFLASGWFDYPAAKNQQDPYNFGGFSKVQPYYTRAGEIYAMRDDVKPFVRAYFNTLPTLLNMENLSLQEHFNGFAAWNKTHETGYFLQQTRFMLAMEHGKDLYLAPLITSNWLKDGNVVSLTNAPTRFGRVSYRIESSVGKGFIDAVIDPPTRNAPENIVLRLRHPEGKAIKTVTVGGKKHADFDAEAGTIRFKSPTGRIEARVEYTE